MSRKPPTAAAEPPEATIPTPEKAHDLAVHAHRALKACIREYEPAYSIDEKVRLALLVRLLKLHSNIIRVAKTGDMHTISVLSRIVFEFSLSFTYMCVNDQNDPGIYEAFRQSALVRVHNIVKAQKKSASRHRKSTIGAIASLERLLQSESYTPPASWQLPKSWHPTLSYEKMARQLGGEFREFYDSFYELTSTSIHPNWVALKADLIIEPDGEARANLITPPPPIHPFVVATCMILKVTETSRIKLIQLEQAPEVQGERISEIRALHHQLHN